jgi:malonyl-CoA O-methyltransferase
MGEPQPNGLDLYTLRIMKSPKLICAHSLSLQFDRRSRTPERYRFLTDLVQERMFERLDYTKIAPLALLDAGCGAGDGLYRLAARFPAAACVGLDVSTGMLAQARTDSRHPALRKSEPRSVNASIRTVLKDAVSGLSRFIGSQGASSIQLPAGPIEFVQAQAESMPFANSRFDLVWSNLLLHWCADPMATVSEWQRVLRPNGLVMFSSFGVDTCRELTAIGLELPTFQDMHDIGDALSAARFADPVMDSEVLTLTYMTPDALLRDLHGIGGNALKSRFRGLRTPAWLERQRQRILALPRDENGALRLTIELNYGHAWVTPEAKLPDGYAPVRFIQRQQAA